MLVSNPACRPQQGRNLPWPLGEASIILDIAGLCITHGHPNLRRRCMDSINWDALGAMGDFLGSIGVFISLVYLAYQTKQGAAETRDASIHSVMELAIRFRSESYTGDLADIRLKAGMNETLTPLEDLKYQGYLSALFELNELVFLQYQKDNLDPEYFEAWERRTRAAISVPRIKQFWARTKEGYRASFVQYIDKLMSDGD